MDKVVSAMENLKPCPFCGGKASVWEQTSYNNKRFFFILCQRCAARTGMQETRNEAIAAWNWRVSNEQQPLVADRNKLKDKLILNICSHCDSRFDYCGECPIIKDINEAFDEQ